MKKILIAGAGTAGLASASLLAKSGHEVTVVEAVPALAPVGAGLLIQPSGQQVLHELKLLNELQSVGSRIDALHGYNRSGTRVFDLDYRDLNYRGLACLDPNFRAHDHQALAQHSHDQSNATHAGLGLHRGHLADALYRKALHAGVHFRFGENVSSFEQTARDVSVSLPSGQRLNADLLVIANGTRSALRQQLGIPCQVRPYPWGALWAICESDNWQSPHWLEQVYDGPRRMLGVLPTGRHPVTGRHCYSLFWSLPRKQLTEWQSQSFSQWREVLQAYCPSLAPLLTGLNKEQIAWAEYSDVVMPHWHNGRVVCIGDAAHAMSPQLGQGANLALIDAYCLAKAVSRYSDTADALAQYSSMRKAHLHYYQRASRWLTPLYQSHWPLGILRDCSTRFSRHIPSLYQQALLTLTGHKAGLFGRFHLPG